VARDPIFGISRIGVNPLSPINLRKYIDFTAGIAVVALGHADPALAHLMYDQALQLIHCSNLYHSPWPGELAKLIIETTKSHFPQSPFQKVFISNSGTEANEGALKFARKVGKVRGGDTKTDIVCFERGFHGRTFGALSVTPQPKYQKPFAPMVPGVKIGIMNDIPALETLVDEKTCGVIVEPIQGEGGVYEASEEFLTALRERCNKVGAVLIYDEIQVHLSLCKIDTSVVFLEQESYGHITIFRHQLPQIY
jgi:acetylornithine aminotransferase